MGKNKFDDKIILGFVLVFGGFPGSFIHMAGRGWPWPIGSFVEDYENQAALRSCSSFLKEQVQKEFFPPVKWAERLDSDISISTRHSISALSKFDEKEPAFQGVEPLLHPWELELIQSQRAKNAYSLCMTTSFKQ